MTDSVLVADDDDLFRQQLVSRLQQAGLNVVAACSSLDQARARLLQLPSLNAAVLDLKLGPDSGVALIEPLLARFPGCRVVMLTGYGSIPSAVDATRRGALDYLVKPVDMVRLVTLLRGETVTEEPPPLPQAPPSLARLEWDYIQQVLRDNQGNVSATARQLGIDRRTLQRKLQKRPSANDYQRDRQCGSDLSGDH